MSEDNEISDGLDCRRYTCAELRLEKLSPLGPWFHASDLARSSGMSQKTLKQSLWRWCKEGLLHPLGGRSSMYHNSLFYPANRIDVRQALARVTPRAIDASLSILTLNGLWTQHSKHLTLLQQSLCRVYKIDDVRFSVRSSSWLKALNSCGAIKMGAYLQELTPGAILADVLIHEPARAPDPSDLDFDDLEFEDAQRFRKLMGFEGDDVSNIESEYRDALMKKLAR